MVRDKKGRFAKGNGGGPGRPPKKREELFMDILVSTCAPERWVKICAKAIEQAERGDATARKWVSDYLMGPPIERKEITGKDGGIIRVTLKGLDD